MTDAVEGVWTTDYKNRQTLACQTFIRRLVGSASTTEVTQSQSRARPGGHGRAERMLSLYTAIDTARPWAGEAIHVWGHGRYLGWLESVGTLVLCHPGELVPPLPSLRFEPFTVLQFVQRTRSLKEALAVLSNPSREARGRNTRGHYDRAFWRRYRKSEAVREERDRQRYLRGLHLDKRGTEQVRYFPIPGDSRLEVEDPRHMAESGATWAALDVGVGGITATDTRRVQTFTRAAWASHGAVYIPKRAE